MTPIVESTPAMKAGISQNQEIMMFFLLGCNFFWLGDFYDFGINRSVDDIEEATALIAFKIVAAFS